MGGAYAIFFQNVLKWVKKSVKTECVLSDWNFKVLLSLAYHEYYVRSLAYSSHCKQVYSQSKHQQLSQYPEQPWFSHSLV